MNVNPRTLRPARPLVAGAVLAWSLVAAFSLSCGTSREDGSPPRSAGTVLVVTVDALRPERLSVYGGEIAVPAIEALAAEGIVFDDATTVAPVSLPAVVSAWTGLAPDRSGVRHDVVERLEEPVATVPVALAGRGWDTVAVVGSEIVSYPSGLDAAFALFDGPEALHPGPEAFAPPARRADTIAGAIESWASSAGGGGPTLVWTHFADLSGVYPGGVFKGEEDPRGGTYAERMAAVDAAVGRIVAALRARGTGRVDVVLVGTYAPFLGEDGRWGAGFWLDGPGLRVPLIVAGPAVADRAGSRDGSPASVLDVAPTVAALAGLDGFASEEGRDLTRPETIEADRVRRAWTWAPEFDAAWPALAAVRVGAGPWESFTAEDLAATGPGADSAAALAAQRPPTAIRTDLPEPLETAVAAIGVRRVAPIDRAPTFPEPRRSEFFVEIQRLRWAVADGRTIVANRTARRLREAYPEQLAVLATDAYFADASGAHESADRFAETLLRLYPRREVALHTAAHSALRAGDLARAETLLRAALALGGPYAEISYDLACLRALSGDARGAVELLGQAIDRGFRNWFHIERDPDLVSIRSTREYAELLGRYGR